MSNNMLSSPTGLQQLPLELRNDIYENTIGEVDKFTIQPGAPGSWLQSLYNQFLPPLRLNRQIEDEAKEVALSHVMRVVKEITLPSPDDLLSVVPSHIQFANLRRLHFTRPQRSLNESSDDSSFCVDDIVQRSPQLEELTIPVSARVLLEDDYQSHFSAILGLKNIAKLNLTCADAPRIPGNWVYGANAIVLQPFEEWFLRESATKGRHIALDINLSPNTKYRAHDPQCSRRQLGSIRWIEFADFFG
jgi:hypothetical protein